VFYIFHKYSNYY